MRLIILAVLMSGFSLIANAQSKITVSILDSFGIPLSKATVSLHKAETKSIVMNTITDSSGKCFFNGVTTGNYFISSTAIGYHQAFSADFFVPATQSDSTAHTIQLGKMVKELVGVTIRSYRPLIEANEDKIVYNVEDDPSLQGFSASEAFSKVPFVSIDGNGNVQLKGQSSFQILLNGKQTSMFATNMGEVLKSFPANSISRIEVITNPSAKYEGEGITGLINIITKKKVAGYNGHTSFTYNTNGQVNPNGSFNLKYGKLGITSFIYYARNTGMKTFGFQKYTALTPSAPFAYRHFADTGRHAGYNSGGNLELAYDIDTLQAVSLYGRLTNGGNEPKQLSNIITYDQAGNPLKQSIFETKENADFPGGEIGIDYLKKFRSAGRNVSLNINRQFRKITSVVNSSQYNRASIDRFLLNNSRAKNIQTSFQADYTLPLTSRSKIETGIRGIFREVNSQYKSHVKDLLSGTYIPDPSNSNELNYTQNVAGAYAVYSYSIKEKRFLLRAGARLEKTKVRGNFISSNTKVAQDYFSFLPSISITKSFKNGKRLSLAFNRRLARPGLSFLNPFKDNRDPLFITYGNERLKPEFANNVDLGIASFSQKITYSIALNASIIRGGIQRLLLFNEISGLTEQTYSNVGRTNLFGVNTYLSLSPGKKFSATFTANLNYASIKNTLVKAEKNSGFYGSLNTSFSFDISEKIDLFSTVSYSAAPLQLQGQNGDYLFYNIGGSYWIFKKKLMLSLAMLNVFNKHWLTDNKSASSSFQQLAGIWRPARALSAGLRFNFGKLKENTSKKRGVTVDDTKQDIN